MGPSEVRHSCPVSLLDPLSPSSTTQTHPAPKDGKLVSVSSEGGGTQLLVASWGWNRKTRPQGTGGTLQRGLGGGEGRLSIR